MKRWFQALAFLVGAVLSVAPASAGLVIQHQGATNPTTEGFTAFAVSSGTPQWSHGPVTNDLGTGVNAYQVSSNDANSQVGYFAQLSASTVSAIQANGATFTLISRVSRAASPATPPGGTVYGSDATFELGNGRRYDIIQGADTQGNTIIGTASDLLGGWNYYTPGTFVTLPGMTYHTIQLRIQPSSIAADLYIDGVLRISGYTGQTHFTNPAGISFGADNGGAVNFNLVRLDSDYRAFVVPEPSTLVSLSVAVALAAVGFRRRKSA